jgi:hypothetical protein
MGGKGSLFVKRNRMVLGRAQFGRMEGQRQWIVPAGDRDCALRAKLSVLLDFNVVCLMV